jgi:hypothetical protein
MERWEVGYVEKYWTVAGVHMKPITLNPDEIKSLQSGRVVIWREMKEQPKGELCPCIGDGEWHDKGSGLTVFEPYQPGAEFCVQQSEWCTQVDDIDCVSLLPRGRICARVVSVEPEQRETWGWRVELEVV